MARRPFDRSWSCGPVHACRSPCLSHPSGRVAAAGHADCLIQARSAEHWLASAGIASKLHFGVPKTKQPVLEAHAWLTVGDRIVTGGDISGYVPLER